MEINYSPIWKREGITPAEKLYNYVLKNEKRLEATFTDMGEGMSAAHFNRFLWDGSLFTNLILDHNTRKAKFFKSWNKWPEGDKLIIKDGLDDPDRTNVSCFRRICYWGTFDNGLAVIGSDDFWLINIYSVIDKEFNLIIPFRMLKVDGKFVNVEQPTPEHVQQLLDEARATLAGKQQSE